MTKTVASATKTVASATKTVASATKDYKLVLDAKAKLKAQYEADLEAIDKKANKIRDFILGSEELIEFDENYVEQDPYLFWKKSEKRDVTAVICGRLIRESITTSNGLASTFEANQKHDFEEIKAWVLSTLNERGSKSFNCDEAGKVYKKMTTRASPTDFEGLMAWAVANNEFSMVQSRLSTTAINAYFDKHGEYPPHMNVSREWDVVISK
jgi:hypothetical protein